MSEIYIPLVSALVGALIGSLSSIITIVIQAKFQSKRELTRLATEAAIEDHKVAYEIAKGYRNAQLAPLTAFIHYHIKTLKLLEEGELSEEDMAELKAEQQKLFSKPDE